MVWFNYRRVPAITLAKQLIDEGRIGRPYHFRANFLQDWTISADVPQGGDALWRLDVKAAGSGVTGDLLAHNIDTAMWLNGAITRVVARTETFVKERMHTAHRQGGARRHRRCLPVHLRVRQRLARPLRIHPLRPRPQGPQNLRTQRRRRLPQLQPRGDGVPRLLRVRRRRIPRPRLAPHPRHQRRTPLHEPLLGARPRHRLRAHLPQRAGRLRRRPRLRRQGPTRFPQRLPDAKGLRGRPHQRQIRRTGSKQEWNYERLHQTQRHRRHHDRRPRHRLRLSGQLQGLLRRHRHRRPRPVRRRTHDPRPQLAHRRHLRQIPRPHRRRENQYPRRRQSPRLQGLPRAPQRQEHRRRPHRTPVFLHPEHYEAAILAKKHIYCEKPAGADVAGCKRMLKAWEKRDKSKRIQFGFQQRFSSQYLKSHSLSHQRQDRRDEAHDELLGPRLPAPRRRPQTLRRPPRRGTTDPPLGQLDEILRRPPHRAGLPRRRYHQLVRRRQAPAQRRRPRRPSLPRPLRRLEHGPPRHHLSVPRWPRRLADLHQAHRRLPRRQGTVLRLQRHARNVTPLHASSTA